jgi:parallel beta-helix repeat protein
VDILSRNNVTVTNIVTRLCGYDIRLSDSSNCIISDIFVEDYLPNDIYLENSSNNVISGNFGEIKLYESGGNILLDNLWSLTLFASFNNTISGNRNSIELSMSVNNTISKNNSSIRFYSQSNGNIISENNGFIGLWDSSNNHIIGNNGAILIFESNNNTVIQNTVKDESPYGIQLAYSSGNIFSENIIQNNKLDIRYVINNTFYHNDFLNASMYIVDDATVFWDNGSEGNYWDNYTGLDENEDGIGDTPYIIDENNQDNFPLMEPVIILEFPSWIILPLFLTITLVSIILRKSMTRKT